MKNEHDDRIPDPLLTPKQWAELEMRIDDIESGREPLLEWNEFASRIRRRFGWPASKSGPKRKTS